MKIKYLLFALFVFISFIFCFPPSAHGGTIDESGDAVITYKYQFTVANKEIAKYKYINSAKTSEIIYFRNPRTVTQYNYTETFYTQDPKSSHFYDVIRVRAGLNSRSDYALVTYVKANPTDIMMGDWVSTTVLDVSGTPLGTQPSTPDSDSTSDSTSGSTPQKLPEDFQYETPASWTGKFVSMFNCTGGTCDTYEEWIQVVWAWALTIAIPLSVLILSAAGVIWMTSEGNPERITLAKRLITGVLSGLGLLILARIVLVNIIGIDSGKWNAN